MSRRAARKRDKIVIDLEKGLEFGSEDELYQHFYKEISTLETEFFAIRPKDDIPESEFSDYEENLTHLLDAPDEIWRDLETMPGVELFVYLRKFEIAEKDASLFHVAVVYLTDRVPSFVYLHFPTQSEGLVVKYRRGEKIYDRLTDRAALGAIDGDALREGDDFARGLYHAMLKVRSDSDIKEDKFKRFAHLREDSIEQPDEIWRSNDSMGNVLVSFIKEFPDETPGNVYYIVVTLEDVPSNSHALLFSFPTIDEALVGRYRHGENLQAEEVVQEASH